MAEKLGFVGLGRMGGPMVRRLLARGYELYLRDVNDAALAPFKEQPGVHVCASPRDVAAQAPVILLSLPMPRTLDEVVLGPDGVTEAGGDRVVIDLSTSGVAAARRVSAAVRARGMRYLDAPVSGGVSGAEKGTLAVMVAGDRALHDRYRELLAIIGKNVFYVGAEPGQGQAMKLANNMLSATAVAATAEALAVTTKARISPKLALDVLNASSGRNTATEAKYPQAVITGRFDFGFLTRLLLKDVKLFEELAEELAVPTLVAEATVNAWRIAAAQGYADQDITAIAKMYERWSGVEMRDTPGA